MAKQKPVFGNFGTLGRTYGEPKGPKPTMDEQANKMYVGGRRKNERASFPRQPRKRQ